MGCFEVFRYRHVFLPELVGVAEFYRFFVRVLAVEVVVALREILRAYLPGILGLLAAFAFGAAPPGLLAVELLDRQRLRLGIRLVALGIGMLEKPHVLRRAALFEKEHVRVDARVGTEDPLREPDDCVEIELLEELLLERRLRALSEEETIGKDNRRAARVGFEKMHDKRHEKVRRLARLVLPGEVVLDPVLFHPAERGIRYHDINPVLGAVILERTSERIVVPDVRRHVDPVEHHVRHREHVREGLLLDAVNARGETFFVFGSLYLILQIADRAGKETARTARGIENLLAELRIDDVNHELRKRARGVVLARVSRGLQVAEELFVDVAEKVAVARRVEVDVLLDRVDDLPEERARLHVVVRVLEHRADDLSVRRCPLRDRKLLEEGKELVIDEVDEFLAGDSLAVLCPGGPAEPFLKRAFVTGNRKAPFLFLIIEYLEKKEPDDLADSLRVSVDADVLSHNILNRFDERSDCHLVSPVVDHAM